MAHFNQTDYNYSGDPLKETLIRIADPRMQVGDTSSNLDSLDTEGYFSGWRIAC